ncbi:hypothetical protein [Streptomyces sp. ST2-7A]|uniref:hypothetical protein n=1 Tax=Streptomyces sp. ST2-7A TaxID=2907214 RepID=UPI001F34C9EE|nr:hypothetical protein [Streptomyces sp. ST2-7A]MCE7082261.1 hypothetical protein [Streptomyces sp. ST2-7A]
MVEEPRSGRLVAWGNALLAGVVSPDEAVREVTHGDDLHRVTGLPGEDGPVGPSLALGRLRALGTRGLRIALPVPGHPLGLSGPAEFNAAALEAGEAVIAEGIGLGWVPVVTRAGPVGGPAADRHVSVEWRCSPVREAPPTDVPSLGEAERELAEALRSATESLTRMAVAGAGPVARAELSAYRARAERGSRVLAPGYPPRAVRVLELARRVGDLVDIANAPGEHGAAVSAGEIAAREAVLRPVERTARRARVAAYNAFVEHGGSMGV